jgi:hypothetical protein
MTVALVVAGVVLFVLLSGIAAIVRHRHHRQFVRSTTGPSGEVFSEAINSGEISLGLR